MVHRSTFLALLLSSYPYQPSVNVNAFSHNVNNESKARIEYRKWANEFGKEQSEDRFEKFSKNLAELEAYALAEDMVMELNEYADMSMDEFEKIFGTNVLELEDVDIAIGSVSEIGYVESQVEHDLQKILYQKEDELRKVLEDQAKKEEEEVVAFEAEAKKAEETAEARKAELENIRKEQAKHIEEATSARREALQAARAAEKAEAAKATKKLEEERKNRQAEQERILAQQIAEAEAAAIATVSCKNSSSIRLLFFCTEFINLFHVFAMQRLRKRPNVKLY